MAPHARRRRRRRWASRSTTPRSRPSTGVLAVARCMAPADWRQVQSRFVIPPDGAAILPRLTGHGTLTAWADDLALHRVGQIDLAKGRNIAAGHHQAQLAAIEVTFYPADGTIETARLALWTGLVAAARKTMLRARCQSDGPRHRGHAAGTGQRGGNGRHAATRRREARAVGRTVGQGAHVAGQLSASGCQPGEELADDAGERGNRLSGGRRSRCVRCTTISTAAMGCAWLGTA